MNEKEARKIVARKDCDLYPLLLSEAEGYLACINGPEVAALKAEIRAYREAGIELQQTEKPPSERIKSVGA